VIELLPRRRFPAASAPETGALTRFRNAPLTALANVAPARQCVVA
jgi:hypothetical protein